MYKVVKAFTDLQDSNHVYIPEEPYPRKGYAPSEERIAELSGTKNKLGYPLIVKTEEAPEIEVLEVPINGELAPEDDSSMTEVPEEATEEAKEVSSTPETGENGSEGPEAKRTPKKARGKVSGKE